MSAFQRAVLSVNPDRLEQFTKEMKKNISEKSIKKVSRRHRSPSDASSRRSKIRKRHSKSIKEVVAKSSSQSIKASESKGGKSSKSATKDSRKHHKRKSESDVRKAKEDSDFDESDLDLSNPLFSLINLVKDRKALLETAFSIVQGTKLTAMLPDSLKLMPVDEVKRLCDEHLNVMSSKRIFHVLSGTSMDSSSGTDSSDEERPAKGGKQHDMPLQDHTLQTNLVDSTTSESAGPSMLFPSALSTAQCSMHDKDVVPLSSTGFDDVPTSTSPAGTHVVKKCSSTRKSETEDGELDTIVFSGKDFEIHNIAEQVSEVKDVPVDTDEVFVEEVEEIEEMSEDHIHECEFQTADDSDKTVPQSSPASGDILAVEDYSGKTQLEILELELRARAIQSLMKAAKTGSLKTAPSEK